MADIDCIDFERFYTDALQDDLENTASGVAYPTHFDELESSIVNNSVSPSLSLVGNKDKYPAVLEGFSHQEERAASVSELETDQLPLSWAPPSNRTAQPREQFSVNDYTDLVANIDQPQLPPTDVASSQPAQYGTYPHDGVEATTDLYVQDVHNYQIPLQDQQVHVPQYTAARSTTTTTTTTIATSQPHNMYYDVVDNMMTVPTSTANPPISVDGDCQTDPSRTKYIVSSATGIVGQRVDVRKSIDQETQTADGQLRAAISEPAISPVRRVSTPVPVLTEPATELDIDVMGTNNKNNNNNNSISRDSEVRYVAEIQRLRRSMADQRQFHEEKLQQLDSEGSQQKHAAAQLQEAIAQMEITSQEKDEQIRVLKSELQLAQSAAASPRRSKEKEELIEYKRLVAQLRDDATSHQTELAKAKGCVHDLEGDLKQVRSQHQIALDDQQKREKIIQANTAEIDRLKNELRMIHERVHKSEVATSRLTTDKNTLEDTIRSLNISLGEKDKEIEKHVHETHSARSDHSASESEKSKIEHQLNSLTHEHGTLQREFAKLQSKYESAQSSFTDLDKKFKNLKLEMAQMQHAAHSHPQSVPKAQSYEPPASASPVRKPLTRREIALQEASPPTPKRAVAEYENDNWAPTNSEMRVIRKVLNQYDSHPHHQSHQQPEVRRPLHSSTAAASSGHQFLENDRSGGGSNRYHSEQQHTDPHRPQERLVFEDPPVRQQHQQPTYESPQRNIPTAKHEHRPPSPAQRGPETQCSGGMGHLGGGLSGLAGYNQPRRHPEAQSGLSGSNPQQSPPHAQCTQQWLEDKIVELSHDRSLRIDELAKINQSKPKSIAERKYKMKQEQNLQALEKEINGYKIQLRKLSHPAHR